ncbi:hypothetical protein VB773_17860 [Haloarculaceae archaeon H-GB2-1]|nr:hypothetical protein [Haloarculaceae archaeon H-GB1-1]MEA5387761.1 hypothetical protein [Haloarculaceae archaeon H-GB11]MEA5409254.1 hypothetical protein [Haloarculaceae archaeon H-GB2-1]
MNSVTRSAVGCATALSLLRAAVGVATAAETSAVTGRESSGLAVLVVLLALSYLVVRRYR